jgi:hypothetical protein
MFRHQRGENIAGLWALGSAVTTHTVIPSEVENGASATSDIDGTAARVAARESGDERVKSLDAFSNEIECSEYHLVFGMRI